MWKAISSSRLYTKNDFGFGKLFIYHLWGRNSIKRTQNRYYNMQILNQGETSTDAMVLSDTRSKKNEEKFKLCVIVLLASYRIDTVKHKKDEAT